MTEPSYLRAIRAADDTLAVDYAERLSSKLAGKPLDRAMLAGFTGTRGIVSAYAVSVMTSKRRRDG